MAESFPYLGEKEKQLIMSNFSFSRNVFKRLVMQTHKNQGLLGKGLTCQLSKLRLKTNQDHFYDVKDICANYAPIIENLGQTSRISIRSFYIMFISFSHNVVYAANYKLNHLICSVLCFQDGQIQSSVESLPERKI